MKLLALLACQCYGFAWSNTETQGRVKLENVGIVGMPVIWLGVIFIERRASLRRLCDIPSYFQKKTSYGRV